ncbi:hypothetical protein ACQ4PT_054543 [Festuca glaucescens]
MDESSKEFLRQVQELFQASECRMAASYDRVQNAIDKCRLAMGGTASFSTTTACIGVCNDASSSDTDNCVMEVLAPCFCKPDTNLVIANNVEDLAAPTPARCLMEGSSRGSTELRSTSAPATAPMMPTAIVDIIPVLTAAPTSDGILNNQAISGVATTPATFSTVCLCRHPVAASVLVVSSQPTPSEYVLDTNNVHAAEVPLAIMGEFLTVLVPTAFTLTVQLQQIYDNSELFSTSSSQCNTSKVPVHRPMPWPSFMGVHADGDEVRPRPWLAFKRITDCESSSDAIMKPYRRCTSDSFPMTTGDVVEFQILDYYGNLCTSSSCITIHDMSNAGELRYWNDVLLFIGYAGFGSACLPSVHTVRTTLSWPSCPKRVTASSLELKLKPASSWLLVDCSVDVCLKPHTSQLVAVKEWCFDSCQRVQHVGAFLDADGGSRYFAWISEQERKITYVVVVKEYNKPKLRREYQRKELTGIDVLTWRDLRVLIQLIWCARIPWSPLILMVYAYWILLEHASIGVKLDLKFLRWIIIVIFSGCNTHLSEAMVIGLKQLTLDGILLFLQDGCVDITNRNITACFRCRIVDLLAVATHLAVYSNCPADRQLDLGTNTTWYSHSKYCMMVASNSAFIHVKFLQQSDDIHIQLWPLHIFSLEDDSVLFVAQTIRACNTVLSLSNLHAGWYLCNQSLLAIVCPHYSLKYYLLADKWRSRFPGVEPACAAIHDFAFLECRPMEILQSDHVLRWEQRLPSTAACWCALSFHVKKLLDAYVSQNLQFAYSAIDQGALLILIQSTALKYGELWWFTSSVLTGILSTCSTCWRYAQEAIIKWLL